MILPALSRGVLLSLLLAACTAPPPREGVPGAAAPDASEPPVAPGASIYRLDPQHSEVLVRVYRAGALASLGHNHVILLRPSRGWVVTAQPSGRSSLRVEFTVAAAQVDDPAVRRREGPDFPGEIDEDAKSGTLHNMLSSALLDADRFPTALVRGSTVGVGPAQDFTLTLRFTVAGRESRLKVPVRLERSGAQLAASGEFALKQSELGLKPFSILLGALQVQDQMSVRYRIVANR